MPHGVEPYDETITSERIVAVGDLYYIYQHETIGVFRVSPEAPGAVPRRRRAAVERAGRVLALPVRPPRGAALHAARPPRRLPARARLRHRAGARRARAPNADFHKLFRHFINQVTLYWRDKRISDVIRERAYDPSFGSIADRPPRRPRPAQQPEVHLLRPPQRPARRGHAAARRGLPHPRLADDIKRLFGADNAWDVVEEVLVRYFNERLVTSPRQRMGVAGREILRWLAQPHILQTHAAQFETLLLEIAEYAEEWLTSAQAMGLAERRATGRVLPFERAVTTPGGAPSNGRRAAREFEYEL